MSEAEKDLIRRGLLALKEKLRASIAEINYSMEKLKVGDTEVHAMYVRGRDKMRKDIEGIDKLLGGDFDEEG